MPATALHITSPTNPLLLQVRRLSAHPSAYRKAGVAWLEGEHLVTAALARRQRLHTLLWAGDSPPPQAWAAGAERVVTLPPVLLRGVGTLGAQPVPVGALLALPPTPAAFTPGVATVVLDRLQDAGNVGSILRSAAALGVRQVVALRGTALLWSPKVLRAGMGAHFALALHEGASAGDLPQLRLPLLATSSHGGLLLGQQPLPAPCAWVFGNEGQGVAPELLASAHALVRIPQPGGEESLNVAAAAAICLFVGGRQAD